MLLDPGLHVEQRSALFGLDRFFESHCSSATLPRICALHTLLPPLAPVRATCLHSSLGTSKDHPRAVARAQLPMLAETQTPAECQRRQSKSWAVMGMSCILYVSGAWLLPMRGKQKQKYICACITRLKTAYALTFPKPRSCLPIGHPSLQRVSRLLLETPRGSMPGFTMGMTSTFSSFTTIAYLALKGLRERAL